MMNFYQVNQHKVVLALCLIVFNLFNRINTWILNGKDSLFDE